MSCINCNSNRIASVFAKCDDKFVWESDVDDHQGYVKTPGGEIGSGDEVQFSYCLDCGRIQHDFPTESKFKFDSEEY